MSTASAGESAPWDSPRRPLQVPQPLGVSSNSHRCDRQTDLLEQLLKQGRTVRRPNAAANPSP